MLLAADIGNTNIALGVFAGEDLMATWRIATEPGRMPDEDSNTMTLHSAQSIWILNVTYSVPDGSLP